MPSLDPITVITWAVLLAIPMLLLWFATRRRKRALALRPIPAWEALRGLMGRATEEGRQVHLSLGRAGVGGEQTAVVSAALDVQRHLAREGAALDADPQSPSLVVTVADPLLMLTAQDSLYRAYRAMDHRAGYDATQVQLIAPDALAYAVGAQDRIDDERTLANVMVGHQGDEYLLLGETGAQRDLLQVAGSDALNAQALMTATSGHVLVGEETFAAGAYLTRRPALVASLQVQDLLRAAAVVAILVGVLVKSLAFLL
jgi:hypothetical protein